MNRREEARCIPERGGKWLKDKKKKNQFKKQEEYFISRIPNLQNLTRISTLINMALTYSSHRAYVNIQTICHRNESV